MYKMVKNTKICHRCGKNNRFKALSAIFLVLAILCISSISAWDFDNWKSYDEETKTATIKNAFNLGSTIAEAQLKTPQVVRVIDRGDGILQKVAEFEVDLKWDSYPDALKEMKFYNANNMKEINREFEYRVGESYIEQRPIYEQVCVDVLTELKNGTQQSCSNKLIGYENITKWRYDNVLNTKDLSNGITRIAIYTDVQKGDYVEWIPTMFGKEIEEWATWKESGLVWDSYGGTYGGSQPTPDLAGGRIIANMDTTLLNVTVVLSPNSTNRCNNLSIWTKADGLNKYSKIIQDSEYQGFHSNISINEGDGFNLTANTEYYIVLSRSGDACNQSLHDPAWSFPYEGIRANMTYGAYSSNGESWTDNYGGGAFGVKAILTANESISELGEFNVELLTPADNLLTSSNTLDFSARQNASGIYNHTNITLYIWNSSDDEFIVDTDTLSGNGSILNEWNDTGTFTDDDYNWDVYGCFQNQTGGVNCTWSYNGNYSFEVDTTEPSITLTSPPSSISDVHVLGENLSLNWSVTDSNLDSCWYEYLKFNNLGFEPLSYYPFEESSGRAFDIYTTNRGNIIGNIQRNVDGKIGKAYNFSGDGYVNNQDINFTQLDNGFSISLWVNGEGLSSNERIFSISKDVYIFYYESLSLLFIQNGATGHSVSQTMDSDLRHLILTYNGENEVKTYMNNELKHNLSITLKEPLGNNLTIGTTWKGKIDEFVIFDKVLSESERGSLYNSGNGSRTYNINESKTVTCADNNISFETITQYENIIFYANDTLGNSNSTTTSWVYELLFNSESYTNSTSEGSIESFSINITFNSSEFTNSDANLYYNNTFYGGTKTGSGDTVIYSVNLTTPDVSSITNIPFNWQIGLNNGSWNYYNTSTNNQSVYSINVDDCSDYSIVMFNFSLKDEETKNLINASAYNTEVEIDLDVYPSGASSPYIQYYNNFTQNNNPRICINESLEGTYELKLIATYSGENYSKEFYNIHDLSFTNSSLEQNIDLFDLKSEDATWFKITYKDASFLPVENALIQVQKKYISDGIFRTVEIPKTDSDGEAGASLEVEDQIYTFIITKDGVVLATFSNKIPECQNPTLRSCEINFNSFSTSIETEDYTTGDDFSYTLTYDKSTRIVQSTYSIPSGSSETVSLNVTMFDSLGTKSVCDDEITSASGTLSCTIPTSFGNSSAIVRINKNGDLAGYANINLQKSPQDIFGSSLVFLGIFMFLTLIGLGVGDNPLLMGAMLMLGGILAVALNLIDSGGYFGAGATILWLLIAIVIIIVKGVKRE